MKIRNGFVSNSSSSSFIIDTDQTTFDVARYMLDIRTKDEWPKCPEKDLLKQDKLNIPVSFPNNCNSLKFNT